MRLGIQAQYAGVKRPRQIAATSALTSSVTRFGVPRRRPDTCAPGSAVRRLAPDVRDPRVPNGCARRRRGDARATAHQTPAYADQQPPPTNSLHHCPIPRTRAIAVVEGTGITPRMFD